MNLPPCPLEGLESQKWLCFMHCTTLEGQSVNIRASSSDASLSAGNTILRYVQYIQFSIQPNIGIWDKEMISKISRSPPVFELLHKNGSYIKYLAFKRIQKNIFLWQEGRMFANAKKICLKSRLWRLLRK